MTLEKQRMHPISILIFFFRVIKESYREIISFGIASGLGLAKFMSLYWLFLPLFLFIAYAIAYWARFTFRISENQLILEKGVFSRNSTHIPKHKIQVIHRNSTLLQQLFGLESLSIETAGANENAKLNGIKAELALELQAFLKTNEPIQTKKTEFVSTIENTPHQYSYKASLSDLIFHAVSSRSLGLILAFSIYALELTDDYFDKETIRAARNSVAQFIDVYFVLLVGFVFLLLILSVAIVINLIRYYGFTMSLHSKEIILNYGFFDKKTTTIPIKKVQSIRIVRNPILALFKKNRVFVESSGSLGDTGSGRTMIALLLNLEQAEELVRTFFNVDDLPVLNLRPTKNAWFPYQMELFIPTFVMISGLVWGFSLHPLWYSIVVFGSFLAFIRFKRAGIGIQSKIVRVQSQFINRIQTYIPISTIQSLAISQAPWQRFSNRATFELSLKVGSQEQPYALSHANKDILEASIKELSNLILAKRN